MPTVTFDSIFSWNAVTGAAAYQVRALDAVNNVLTPAPGVIDVTSTSVSVGTLLLGQSPGTYKLQVRAVQAGGANPSGFASLTVNLAGLAVPTGLTVSP